MSSCTERVIIVLAGVLCHCCLIFVPEVGDFRATIGSAAFSFAVLVIASNYDICRGSWTLEHPYLCFAIEFLVRVGVLNCCLIVIWMPILASVTILVKPLEWIGLSTPDPELVTSLLAVIAAVIAVCVTRFDRTFVDAINRRC